MINNPLKSLGDLNQLRKQAQQMQNELESETVTVDENGVRIVMTGNQKIKEFLIDGEPHQRIQEAVEKVIEESQQVAARKLAGMSGGLGGMLQ